MKRVILIFTKVLVFSLIACKSEDELKRFCPQRCVVADGQMTAKELETLELRMDLGECKYGKPVCDENFNVIECVGAVLPQEEICDGLDNDCDHRTDEGFYPTKSRYWFGDESNPCPSGFGVCADIEITCEGEWKCPLPPSYEQQETLCDGLDNDCNGVVDDIEITELCFEEEFWKSTQGECRPGITQCVYGSLQCVGQVLPTVEVCDGIDNDCNSVIDDSEEVLANQYDGVFILDTSGSMCPYIQAVATALDSYVAQFENNDNFKFAIVLMTAFNPRVAVDMDFTDLGTIRNRLLNVGCNGAGWEASLDSMAMVCDEINPLELSWRSGANRMFFAFTDEPAQSVSDPPYTGQDVAVLCLQSSTLPFIWSLTPTVFVDIANSANGRRFLLSKSWQVMFDDLNSIVIQLCEEF